MDAVPDLVKAVGRAWRATTSDGAGILPKRAAWVLGQR
jgi:hypothetical protein